MKPDWMTDDDYLMPYVPECVLPCEAILDDPDRLKALSGPCKTFKPIKLSCMACGMEHTLMINLGDLSRWQTGELIQRAMPYLSPGERELLISGVCGVCFNLAWVEEGE